jgi:preprotein translocase subunit YajC
VSPGVLGQLLPIVLLVLLLFVMVIRPARKRAQKVSRLQAELVASDEVMLTSGIFGTVEAMEGDKVRVSVADGVVLTVHRGAIAEIVHDVPVDDDTDLYDAQDSTDASTDDPGAAAPDDGPSHDATTRGAN